MRIVIEVEVPDDSRYFHPQENGVSIVAFTRGAHGPALVEQLQAASDEGYLEGDFQIAKIAD